MFFSFTDVWCSVVCSGCWQTYRADWLAWLGVLTTVGSGEGLLCGGGGLSGSSDSSKGSSLMCMGGTAVPGPAQVTEAGSGMEMEEDGAEEGGCKPGIEFDDDGGGAVGGRTVLKGWDEKGCWGGPLGCEAAAEGGRGGAGGGWWLAEGGRLCDWVRTGGWAGGGWSCWPWGMSWRGGGCADGGWWLDKELRGLRAGGGGRFEGIWGNGGADTWGGCLWDCGLGIWGMGVVGGGLMWGIDIGAGGKGCSLGGWAPLWEDDWDWEGGVWALCCDWPETGGGGTWDGPTGNPWGVMEWGWAMCEGPGCNGWGMGGMGPWCGLGNDWGGTGGPGGGAWVIGECGEGSLWGCRDAPDWIRDIGLAWGRGWGGRELEAAAGETCGGSEGAEVVGGGGAEEAAEVPGWHWMTGGCWLCRSCCCWAEESESLSLSRGLGMLGEELRLSWSMSLGSLLSSSLMLRPSELSPSPSPSPSHSEGESGRLSSCGDRGEERKRVSTPTTQPPLNT